jgi:hypothetical protein
MTAKTEGVKTLVQEVLSAEFYEPYGEDVILEVCQKVDNNPDWKRTYSQLSDELSRDVVNNWIGKYVKQLTRMKNLRPVKAPEGNIIASYTKLN